MHSNRFRMFLNAAVIYRHHAYYPGKREQEFMYSSNSFLLQLYLLYVDPEEGKGVTCPDHRVTFSRSRNIPCSLS